MSCAINTIELWFVDFAQVEDDVAARCLSLLDDDELTRQGRFVFERDRRAYAISHGLVRTMLSHFRPSIPPKQWRFEANAYGRPEIVGNDSAPTLRFNLSHTRGAALCGVGFDCELGVDIEAVDRQSSCVELADRYFAPTEAADLMRLPTDRRRDGFFDYWTLKESYIKARGMGLAIPLDQFAFSLAPAAPIRLSCSAQLADDGRSWQFAKSTMEERFRLAAAVRRPNGGASRFQLRQVVPTVGLGPAVELV